MSDETPDLSLLGTNDLLCELARRHDALVVLMETDTTETDTTWSRFWKGRSSRLTGMLVRAQHHVLTNDPEQQATV